jgi:uncharacterized membrane protein
LIVFKAQFSPFFQFLLSIQVSSFTAAASMQQAGHHLTLLLLMSIVIVHMEIVELTVDATSKVKSGILNFGPCLVPSSCQLQQIKIIKL